MSRKAAAADSRKPRLPYPKPIGCLEGDWFSEKERLSVLPLLQYLEMSVGCGYFHRHCSTREEFDHQLSVLARYKSFKILYLAFHGNPGVIGGPESSFEVTLDDLSKKMKRSFEGRIVHLGACSTLRKQDVAVRRFIGATGVAAVTGFSRYIGWIDASAFDLVYLALWQGFRSPVRFAKGFRQRYGGIAERLGFVAYDSRGDRICDLSEEAG